jgi:ribosomal protein L7/L12
MAEQLSKEQVEAVANALASGRKIEAIKIYREATGLGLKEAKDFIDVLTPKLIEQDPEKYNALKSTQGVGCASIVIAVLCFGALTNMLIKTIC